MRSGARAYGFHRFLAADVCLLTVDLRRGDYSLTRRFHCTIRIRSNGAEDCALGSLRRASGRCHSGSTCNPSYACWRSKGVGRSRYGGGRALKRISTGRADSRCWSWFCPIQAGVLQNSQSPKPDTGSSGDRTFVPLFRGRVCAISYTRPPRMPAVRFRKGRDKELPTLTLGNSN
jgi:hypothetical protein